MRLWIYQEFYLNVISYNFLKMNQYSMVSKLGEGAFSVVYKVKRREDGR